jgi:predicted flavoprotein YhiN
MSAPKRLVVIGGGAAGFFCAVNAARMNPLLEVILLEKTNKILSKVKVSGGGRCNVTHSCFEIGEMTRNYPRGANFLKKSFHQFFTTDTIKWFSERGVTLKTEGDGRMFPVTDSSQSIIDCLLKEADRYGVQVRLKSEVERVRFEKDEGFFEMADEGDGRPVSTDDDDRLIAQNNQGFRESAGRVADGKGLFKLEFEGGNAIHADFVCIASGGFPKSEMFDWLKQTGHSIEDPVPSLFTFNMPGDRVRELPGVSVPDAQVKVAGSKLTTRGPLLITHWGMSGPAILRLSAWGAREFAACNYHFSILVNWLGDIKEQALQEQFKSLRFELASQKISNRNPFGLPQRLWQYLLEESGISTELRYADLPSKDQNKLVKKCCAQEFKVSGKTTFKEEFVTAGGIKLSEIDPQTMQSKILPGLFFAGEIMDVDGITGGFNFQHAWTSGYIAAKAIAAK